MDLRSLAFSLLLLLFCSPLFVAFACTCGGGKSPSEAYQAASAVIIGEIKKVEPEHLKNNRDEQRTWVQIEKSFKGPKEGIVALYQNGGCDPRYNVGDKWLLYLYSSADKEAYSSAGCGRSSRITSAQDDLKFLEALPDSASRTRISGVISQDSTTLQIGFRRAKNLTDLKVNIIGDKKIWTAITDENGVYEIYDLPIGKYVIKPEVPDNMKISLSSIFGAGVQKDKDGVLVTVSANSGAVANFLVQADNQISGKIVGSDGRLMKDVLVLLLPTDVAETETEGRGDADYTKQDGSYILRNMPAGNYLIVVNKDNKLSGREPFPTTYYPGVFEKEKATIITIGNGDRRTNYDIHIPSMKETITMSGIVQFADEKPAARAQVFFKGTADNGSLVVDVSDVTDDEGHFSLTLLKGSKGTLGGNLSIFSGKYKNCPQIDELIKKQTQRLFYLQTNAIEIEAVSNKVGYLLNLPVSFCEQEK